MHKAREITKRPKLIYEQIPTPAGHSCHLVCVSDVESVHQCLLHIWGNTKAWHPRAAVIATCVCKCTCLCACVDLYVSVLCVKRAFAIVNL